ncbi:family 3 encapsulin nanocompartment shell protein [Dyella tabacisoli]|uniref:Phage major capsid protein n=1 Tax=Dyella tabacisoli TaxID=2282381 RepID=A0A369UHZ9_9GAMM|nr:family 3 encapsulin nanocompartment shell protein [Dyella tabacisoli]RDD80117.1 phage major capsid protein [Dyella tabacisoli]
MYSPHSSLSPAAPAIPPSAEPAGPTPGQAFASAYAKAGTSARVDFPVTITDSFPGFRRRPRIAMRALFKIVKAEGPEATYFFETRPAEAAKRVRDEALRLEAGFDFQCGKVPLQPTRAWVQIPEALLADPVALATFIDFRLLVRLGTAENQSLALGKGGDHMRGLLEMPDLRRLPALADPVTSLLAACEHVEQMGGSADGIVMNPADYFQYLFPRQDVLTGLANLGIRIVRTRMINAGQAIVGDFYAGATIFDSQRSTIAFDRPPEGTFARDGLAVRGEIKTALAIHLPTHFSIAALT